MSKSQPTATNPAKKFFKWKGSTGDLVYYDKEKEEEIVVKLPFEFLVLDELSTIAGFNKPEKSGYWSNEVRSVQRDELTVKTSMGTKEVGLYKDLDTRAKGAKYAASIYISYKEDGEWVLGNFKAVGAAVSAWFDYKGTCQPQNGKTVLSGSTEAKNGNTDYFIPTFEYKSATQEENDIAIDLDKELQVYLSQYLAPRVEPGYEEPPISDSDAPDDFNPEDSPVSFK